MGLLDTIKRFREERAFRAHVMESPYRQAAATRLNSALQQTKIKEHMSGQGVERLTGWLWQKVLEVEAAPDPVEACRFCLVDMTIMHARFAVLVTEPPPAPDPVGLRGTQGVTGALRPVVHEIVPNDPETRAILDDYPDPTDPQASQDATVLHMWKGYWFMETFNSCRRALGDWSEVPEKDYMLPLFHAMCANEEARMRQAVGLPSAMPEDDLGLVPMMYWSLAEFVLAGHPYPHLEWRRHFADQINEGLLRPPLFDKSHHRAGTSAAFGI